MRHPLFKILFTHAGNISYNHQQLKTIIAKTYVIRQCSVIFYVSGVCVCVCARVSIGRGVHRHGRLPSTPQYVNITVFGGQNKCDTLIKMLGENNIAMSLLHI